MPDIYELLDDIRSRPAMYVGQEGTLSNLWCFLTGYQMGVNDRKYSKEHWAWTFHFSMFVRRRLSSPLKGAAAGYHAIILEHTGGDEAKALALFFRLLDEYRASESVK